MFRQLVGGSGHRVEEGGGPSRIKMGETAMERDQVKAAFVRALHAARDRAAELGRDFA